MRKLLRQLSFTSKGLRHELAVAFGLLVTALLVFIGYLFPGPTSFFAVRANLLVVVVISLFIVVLGFVTITQMIEPIIKISRQARRIASGEFHGEIKVNRTDEIGELSTALNRMSRRIRDNMEELRVFHQQTETINVEINKRIAGLSSLMQVSNLISQNAELKEIIETSIDKCLALGQTTFCCVVLKDAHGDGFSVCSFRGPQVEKSTGGVREACRIAAGQGLLGKALAKGELTVVDKNAQKTPDIAEFRAAFSAINAIIAPLVSKRQVHGLLVVGNDKSDFSFPGEDCEFFDLLAKQLSIAIERDLLSAKVEELEVVDSLTGLYNKVFAQTRLDEEIKRAMSFQRPCALAMVVIDHFDRYHGSGGRLAAENALTRIGSILKESIGAVDKAARYGDHEFALILPEKNKRQAIETAEMIRQRIESVFSHDTGGVPLTCTIAIAENPVDGMSGGELIAKAEEMLASAKDTNRIYY